MSGLLSLNDVQGYASLQGSTTQDQVNSLQLTVAFSSDTEPAARTIALWANQGTPEPAYPLTSSRGATTACSIGIDTDDNVSDANSISFVPIVANPGDATTVWIDSGTAHLMRGAVDLETTGTGDVVGPASSTDNAIAAFDGVTGKLLQNTAVTIDMVDNGVNAEYLQLTGSSNLNTALILPSFTDGSLVSIGGSNFIVLSPNSTTSVGMGLGCRNAGGNGNYYFGYESGYNLQITAVDNTMMGAQTMRTATTAKRCVAVGRSALYGLTTGEDNIAMGYEAGTAYTTESDNIAIGNVGVAADAGFIRLGTAGTHLQNFQAGVVGVTTTANDAIPVLVSSTGQLGTVSSSIKTKENIEDLEGSEVVYKLRPVSFNYKDHVDKSKKNIGLIAEEVDEVYPDMVIRHPNVETGELEIRTVDYPRLSILLLKEVQGLNDKYNQLSLQNMSLANELMKIKAVLKL